MIQDIIPIIKNTNYQKYCSTWKLEKITFIHHIKLRNSEYLLPQIIFINRKSK